MKLYSENRSGFSLVELLAVMVIVLILLGVVVGIKPLSQNALNQASDQVLGLLEQARVEAIASNEKVLIVVSRELEDEQRSIGLARIHNNSIELIQRFQRLPKGIMIELDYTDRSCPNLLSLEELDGHTLATDAGRLNKKKLNYATIDRHGTVTSKQLDEFGEVVEWQYVGKNKLQKGCYVILRQEKFIDGVPLSPLDLSVDATDCSLVYISPLTGKASQIPSL